MLLNGTDDNTRFARLFSAGERDRLVRLAYRLLWNRDDAEDVAQDALATAYRQSRSLRDEDKWWPWLCRILVHRCHEHGRQKLRRRRHEAALTHEAGAQAIDRNGAAPADAKAAVARMLQRLPQRQREVLVLRHLQGMSCEEVSEVLGIAPATVRVHAMAAREALRQSMNEQCPEWKARPDAPEMTR